MVGCVDQPYRDRRHRSMRESNVQELREHEENRLLGGLVGTWRRVSECPEELSSSLDSKHLQNISLCVQVQNVAFTLSESRPSCSIRMKISFSISCTD